MTTRPCHKALSDRRIGSDLSPPACRLPAFGTKADHRWLALVLAATLLAGLQGQAAEAEGTVEKWVGALKGEDPKARAEAARALGVLGAKAKDAAPALVEALDDAEGTVRVRAAAALGQVGGPLKRALPVLLTARNDPDDRVREQAETAWKRFGPGVRATVLAMPELLQRNNVQGTQKAAAAVSKQGLQAVPAMIDVLSLEHTTVISPGIFVTPVPTVGNIFPRPSFGSNNRLQANSRLRTVAIEALGKLGPEVIPTLLVALKDRDAAVRDGAVQALALLKPDNGEVLTAIIGALHDRDAWVRQRAVQALGKTGKSSPIALEALVDALKHQDTMVRRAAVQALAPQDANREQFVTTFQSGGMMSMMQQVPGPGTIPPLGLTQAATIPGLIAALDDSDSYVRLRAAEALARLTPPAKESLPALVEQLSDRESSIQQLAGQTLEALGPKAAEMAPALRGLLKGKDPVVRVITARVLGRTGPEGKTLALSVLRETLDEEDPPTRLRAAEGLWDLGSTDEAIPVIIGMLSDRGVGGNLGGMSNLANQAGQILQRIGPNNQEAIPALLEALKTGDLNTKNQILQVFSRLGRAASKAAPDLIALAVSRDANTRTQAIQVLRQLGQLPKEAVPALIEAVKADDVNLRIQVIPLFGQLGPESKAAIPALAGLLKDPRPNVRNEALQVLRRIAPQAPDEAAVALVEVLKDKDLNVRSQAAQILGQVGPASESVVPALIALLKDPVPATRLQAAQILGQLGTVAKSAAPALAEALRDKDQAVRVQAVQHLKQMPTPVIADLIPSLKEMLTDPDPAIRLNTLTVLTARGLPAMRGRNTSTSIELPQEADARLLPVLVDLSKDVRPDIRLQAVLALGGSTDELGREPKVASALMERLDDPDQLVRLRAAQALAFAPRASNEAKAGLRGLVASLEATRPDARSEAAETLGRLGIRAKGEIPALTARRDDPEPSVRHQVALALGRLGPEGQKAAAPGLLETAQQGEPLHRLRAIQTLRRMGERERESELIGAFVLDLLRTTDNRVSPQAAETLAQLGPLAKAAIPELVEMLKDSNQNTRLEAARLLSRLGPAGAKAAGPVLIEQLMDSEPSQQYQVFGLIQGFPDLDLGPAIPGLIEMLKRPELNSRSWAVLILGQLGPAAKEALPALREIVRESQPSSRLQIVTALKQIAGEDDPAVFDKMAEQLRDPQFYNRNAAASALARMGPAGVKLAEPVLLEALQSPDQSTRYQAIVGLSRFRGPEGKQALTSIITALDTLDTPMRDSAFLTLRQFGSELTPAIPKLAAILTTTKNPAFATALVQLLGQVGPNAVPALVEALKTTQGSVRVAVVHALGQIGPEAGSAAPALVDLLDHEDSTLKAAATTWLAELGLNAVEPLIERLGDEDPTVRQAAAEILGRIGPIAKGAVPDLSLALSSNDNPTSVRVAAANALRQIDGERQSVMIVPVLAKALKDDDIAVRRSAAEALARISPLPADLAPSLASALQEPDGRTRLHAATALAHLPGRTDEAVAVLAELLDEDPLRASVLKALELLGPTAQGAIPPLVERLNAEVEAPVVGQLAITLALVAGAEAVAPLVKVCATADAVSQPTVLAALALAGPAGVESLTQMLNDKDVEIRTLAARALGTIDRDRAAEAERAAPALQKALKDVEPTVRIEAAISLAHGGGEAGATALPTLLAAAKNPWLADRPRVVEALGRLGPLAAPAVPTLVLALKDKPLLRLRAAEALRRIGPPAQEAASDLEPLLSDPEIRIRSQAAIAVCTLGRTSETAVPVLVEALRSPALRFSLAQIRATAENPGGALTTPRPTFFYNSGSDTVVIYSGSVSTNPTPPLPVSVSFRRELIETLGKLKEQAREAVPALQAAAKETDHATRKAAAAALEAIDPAAGTTGVEAR